MSPSISTSLLSSPYSSPACLPDVQEARPEALSTDFLHIHSLVHEDIHLLVPKACVSNIQHLLIKVIVVSSLHSHTKSSFTHAHTASHYADLLELETADVRRIFKLLVAEIGERLMESMLWAWLHVLLRSEWSWRQALLGDRKQYCNTLLAQPCPGQHQNLVRIYRRIEDIRALRRVTVFTFKALQNLTDATLPAYQEIDSHDPPPVYRCKILDHDKQFFWPSQHPQEVSCTGHPSDEERRLQFSSSSDSSQNPPASLWNTTQDACQPESSNLDFSEWLRTEPLAHLTVAHHLERRNWSLGSLSMLREAGADSVHFFSA